MKNIVATYLLVLVSGSFLNALSQDSISSYVELVPELTPVIHADSKEIAGSIELFALPTQIGLSSSQVAKNSVENFAAGQIDVTSGNSQSGAKTYTVPVKASEGISEAMTPRIALSYNSQQGNGILGTGWSLSGLSSITRVSKSIYYDDYPEGVKLDCDDAFSLDGNRLIAIEKGESEILFQTERGYVKARGYVQDGDIRYFEVYYPDGRTGEFNPSVPNSLVYPIKKIEDRRGNNIEFRYYYDQYLGVSVIIYNGNRIEFNYEDNISEKIESYRGGKKFALSSRLTGIDCYHKDSLIGSYTLSYTSYETRSLLSLIEFEAGGKSFAPLEFYYGDGTDVGLKTNSVSNLRYSFADAKIVKGKYDYSNNADGIICLPSKNPYYKVSDNIVGLYKFFNEYHPNDSIFIYRDSKSAFAVMVHSTDEDIQIIPTSLVSRSNFSNLLVYHHSDSKCTLSAYGCTVNGSLQTLCVGMTNSLGVTEANTYTLATDATTKICLRGTGATYPYVNIFEPMPLLSQVRTTANYAELSKETLSYENPVIHRYGLGFQGFEAVTRTDYRGLVYRQEYDVYNRGSILVDVTPTDSTKYEYDIVRSSNYLLSILPINMRVHNLVDDFVTQTAMSYDSFGNMTEKIVTYSDGAKATEINTFINSESISDGYCIGLPLNSTKTMSLGSSSLSEMVAVTLYDRGLPLGKVTTRNGLPLKEQTFEYYDNGLTKSVMERAYSSAKRFKTVYEYDSDNKLSRITDPMGFTTAYTYYSDNGLVETITDKTGKTEFTYDEFGREIKRSDPINPQITTAYDWDSARYVGYQMVTANTNGTPSVTYFDPLNRPIQQEDLRIDGKVSAVTTEYDKFGNVTAVSYPHDANNAPSMKTEFSYDLLGRKLSESSPSGKKNTYSYGKLSATETVNGIETMRTFDCRGNLIKVSDPSGVITYELGADGQPDKITAPGGAETTFIYDSYRRIISRTDPSIGTETFEYDSDGNLNSQTDAQGQTTSYNYDTYNRLITMTTPEMTVTYTYDSDTGYLTSVASSNGFTRTLTYDAPGRIVVSKESFENHTIETNYSYGAGLLQQATHKSDSGWEIKENYRYSNGLLKEVVLNDTVTVLCRTEVNDFGQVTETLAGGMSTSYTYDEYGSLTRRHDCWGDDDISDVSLDFDPYNGNLLSRKDNLRNLNEQFDYDGLNRLTSYGGHYADYSDNGNIIVKSDVGAFEYSQSFQPYALEAALFIDADIPTRDQDVTYTSFMRPSILSENDHTATFTYSPEFNRIKLRYEQESQYRSQCYYLGGNYEFENISLLELATKEDPIPAEPILTDTYSTNGGITAVDPGGGAVDVKQYMYDIERLFIGGDAYTAPAVLVKSTYGKGSLKLYYIVRDHVGSIVALVNADGGKVEQKLSYDAWGRLRDPDTHEVYASGKEPSLILGRGYGSYEYLRDFGLVNMNARLYDPVLGRFLSPDPYVQNPTLPQNFNRYSYCLNNPLLYCDPSGEWLGLDDLFVATVGFVAGYFSNAISTGNWGWSSVKSGLKGAGMCWLGYNTAGLATGAITSSTLIHAGQIGFSALMSNITPSVSFKIGNVYLGISISPLMGVGTGGFTYGMGMGISAAYRDIYIGAGVGVGNNYWGWNTKATYRDWGSGYGRTYYNGGTSPNGAELGKQSVGSIPIFAPCGWSVAFSNDCIGDREDRWRSNAVEISKGAFSIGTSVDTNWGKYDSTGGDKNVSGTYNGLSPNLGENRNDKGAWNVGKIHFAPLWVGIRSGAMSCRLGYSHVDVQDLTQNLIHKYIARTSYFLDGENMRTGLYFYIGGVNPFNLWNY